MVEDLEVTNISEIGNVKIVSNILYVNIRGLLVMNDRAKVRKLGAIATNSGCFGIIITETWLTEDMIDKEIEIPGFKVFRADRKERKRGGVCIYIKSDISAMMCLSYSNCVTECVIVKVRELKLVMVGVYRPPDTKLSEFKDVIGKID